MLFAVRDWRGQREFNPRPPVVESGGALACPCISSLRGTRLMNGLRFRGDRVFSCGSSRPVFPTTKGANHAGHSSTWPARRLRPGVGNPGHAFNERLRGLYEVDGEQQPVAQASMLHKARGLSQSADFVSALAVRIQCHLGNR